MTSSGIAYQRLHNHGIASARFEKPDDVIRWLGAVQAQDYAAAKWAIGLRSHGLTNAAIDQAFDNGAILRTHVMRPTWHFVSPADIRWLLALTAPRVKAANVYYSRILEIDDTLCKHCNEVLVKALQGGKHLTRAELVAVLQQAGISGDNTLRFTYIIMCAELDGIICSGARRRKQFTYTLLDERVPEARLLDHDEALAELTKRYFTSHGPATVQDFVWWSGLTVADVRVGLELVGPQLMYEMVDNQTYWFAASMPQPTELSKSAYLLPNYDEYFVGYTDRSTIFDPSHLKILDARGNVLFQHTIVINGQIVGTWKRTMKKNAVILTPNFFVSLNKDETLAFHASTKRYGAFLEIPMDVADQNL
jgi:hypothetical protein